MTLSPSLNRIMLSVDGLIEFNENCITLWNSCGSTNHEQWQPYIDHVLYCVIRECKATQEVL